MRDGTFQRTDIWREGKWLDLWSVVHFLSGVSMGFGAVFFHFGTVPTLVIALLLLIAYEMWEAMERIHETPQNRFMDVVVGMVSFTPTYLFIAPAADTGAFWTTFGFILISNVMLATLGWRESRKAAELEARWKAELAAQKRKIAEQKEKFLAARAARKARRAEKTEKQTRR